MKTKVRLLIGPIQMLARMSPTVKSQKRRVELTKRKIEHMMNKGRLPIISESMPAEKLPIE